MPSWPVWLFEAQLDQAGNLTFPFPLVVIICLRCSTSSFLCLSRRLPMNWGRRWDPPTLPPRHPPPPPSPPPQRSDLKTFTHPMRSGSTIFQINSQSLVFLKPKFKKILVCAQARGSSLWIEGHNIKCSWYSHPFYTEASMPIYIISCEIKTE